MGREWSVFILISIAGWHIARRDHLVGLGLRRPPRERKFPGSNPANTGIFPGSRHTIDFKNLIGTPLAALPSAWRYRVSAGTGWSGVSIL